MVQHWIPSELRLLRKLYADRSVNSDQLVATFGRTLDSIQAKARRLDISRKKWSLQEDRFLRQRYQDPTVDREELAAMLGRSVQAIHARAYKLGLTEPPNVWREEEDSLLRETYLKSCSNPKDIMVKLSGRTWDSIVQRASHLNLGSRRSASLVRRYTFDFDFFQQIDTPDKAYWLGFTYADGSLRDNTLRFGLVVEGEKHLKKLATALRFTGSVRHNPADGRYDLELTHPKFANDLRDKGVVQRKTWCVVYPSFLLMHLHGHFIRGVFDGDGSITTGTTRYRGRIYKTPCMSICGAVPEFLQAIVDLLSSRVGVSRAKVIRRKYKGQLTGTWAFSYSGTPALRIRDFLYGEGGIYMECKRDVFYSFDYSSKRPRDKKHQNERVQQLITDRGGTLLSTYTGYCQPATVQCKEGHIWTTTVRTLKDGAWCPKCRDGQTGVRLLQDGEGNLRNWLKRKGWTLLSEYKGNEEEVTLRCEHGKLFRLKAHSVKREQAQCDCARKKKRIEG